MNEALVFLAAPFAMCLILAGIHCYMGLHVLARGVVFVDLSLAQVAMLGAAVAALFGYEQHSLIGYFLSLACTLTAAALFATVRRFEARVSQEALIGIVYAFASAAIILVLDRTPHGTEELKETLIGQILWVSWTDVLTTLAIYSVVGLVHYLARGPLLRSSFDHENASWRADFLFYGLFGVVITSSTHYAGVLLVFSLLIVPAILANFFFKTLRTRLLFGWVFGALFTFLGVALSYAFDLPVGAFIVVLFTLVPILLFGGLAIGGIGRAVRG
jgi:zinc/manganese transport system permease protein